MSGAVVFRHDALTPFETREMEKAGWRRVENADGSVSWFPPAPQPEAPLTGGE